MQPALNLHSAVAPAFTRPVLAARSSARITVHPVVPVSPTKRNVGQNETSPKAVAMVGIAITAPVASSRYLAQHLAQSNQGGPRLNQAAVEASVAVYHAVAERGLVFFGLEYPVDFSV